MLTFLKNIGWAIAYPFAWIVLICRFLNIKMTANKYRKDAESIEFEERYQKVLRFAKLFLFIKNVEIEQSGRSKIEDKPMLFVANHKSNLDPIVILKVLSTKSIPKPIFIAKKELATSKMADLFDLIDVIYIDRDNLRQMVEAVKNEIEVLKDKNSIVIFPEGTRVMEEDSFGEFKAGAFAAAYEAFVSIQPIILANTLGGMERYASKTKNTHPRKVKVQFLDLIQPKNFMNVNKTIFAKKLQAEMFDAYMKLKQGDTKKKNDD